MDKNLIEQVRQHEVIYNHSLSEYTDQRVRQKAWEEVGRQLKITANSAKTKWDKLRRCFCNARNRRRSTKSGQATKNMTPWKFEQQMGFLLPYLQGRRKRGNWQNSHNDNEIYVPDEEVNNEDDNDADEQEVDERNADAEVTADEEDQEYTTQTQTPSQDDILCAENTKTLKHIRRNKKCACRRTTPTENLVAIMEQNATLRKRKFEDEVTAPKKHAYFEDFDETDIFFLSLGRMTKKLPKDEQTSVKMTVSNVILQAELRSAQAQIICNHTLLAPTSAASTP